jgi:3-dehydroquinate synthetase
MPLPVLLKKPDPEALYSMMFTDKKVVSGKVRFVVPTTPGVSIVKGDINATDVIATLKEIFG